MISQILRDLIISKIKSEHSTLKWITFFLNEVPPELNDSRISMFHDFFDSFSCYSINPVSREIDQIYQEFLQNIL
jgi:hypothetical protein